MIAASTLAQVPVPVTPLIGRERELATGGALLRDEAVRLVTLTGAGGAGKTRLAMQLAHELRAGFSDRVLFVPLAALSDPRMVLPALADRLGVRQTDQQPPVPWLAAALGEERRLIVLDNFEHLLPATGEIAGLLAATHRVTLLVTSRAVLHVTGEHVVEVPPLALPEPGPLPPLAHLRDLPAVRLFVDRAWAASNTFTFSEQSAPDVVEICRRLDGLPLAIELAAARTRLLPPDALLARLERRLPLLTGGARDLPARQQTLRSTVAWSYDLLAPPEQGLLRRLAVFPAGWTIEMAETVSTGGTGDDVLDRLASLVDQSLVVRAGGAGDDVRFAMLETVREFALDRLEACGEADDANERLLTYCINLAERARPELDGRRQHRWLSVLEAEHPAFRAGLAWACTAQRCDAALRLAGALGRFWELHGHIREGRDWLDRTLTAGSGAAAPLRVTALLAAGTLARTAGDYPDARRRLEACLAIQLDLGDRAGAARTWFELAQVAHYLADFDSLFVACRQSLALYRALGDRHGIAVAAGMEGHAAWHLRDYRRARRSIQESIAVWQALGDHISVSWGLWDLGNIDRDEGDFAAAYRNYADGLRGAQRAGQIQLVSSLLDGIASLAVRAGRPLDAARFMAASEAIRETHGLTLPPSYIRDVYTPLLEAVRAAIPADELAEVWATGRALSPEIAIDQALAEASRAAGGSDRSPPDTTTTENRGRLTGREVEVLRLIAAGKSNREIAQSLVLSLNTVYRHVSSIFDKTGAANRTEAALYAHRHGLT